MLVRMLTSFTGNRNGEPWPLPGGTIDVPDHEAADLIRNRYAEPADGSAPVAEPVDDAGDGDAPAEPAAVHPTVPVGGRGGRGGGRRRA